MKFLIAEADPGLGLMLEQLAGRWGAEAIVASDGEAAWRLLQSQHDPVVVIADASLPGIDGATLCESLRQTPLGESCYFILLASSLEPFDVDRATHAGVDDLVLRPFSPGVLDLRVRAAQTILDLRAHAKTAEDIARSQATRDELTGTLNRSAILGQLDREASRSSRDLTSLAVLAISVDDLARVAEWHGQDIADQVLVGVCRRVERLLRPYDGFGRYADDEFLAVLPMCDAARAAGVAARVRNHVATEPVETHARALSVTVSVGVAAGSTADRAADLIAQSALAAARRAREAGGNRMETAAWPEGAGV